ncbi:EAL domain-containing protein [Halalkalibacillus sediminis]|uniref:EAL domain-containing protein n=1 Tax=Halalkalibacillus sediminis TaxID=2018042 RepID=A0A2I0QYC4_9BACI|nr:EAL domain-containing protein [Halalkalibacillus sediminis]PKR79334.1 EAL domain-containing protein [Halalkalibacillus sediminis]
METLCKFCGTVSPLVESGFLHVHSSSNAYELVEKYIEATQLSPSHLSIPYDSHQEIIPALKGWIDAGYGEEWIKLSPTEEIKRPMHLMIKHLYHRSINPELVKIIENEQFEAHLQPIFNIQKNELYGYESLIRTTAQTVSPGQLFKFADDAGLHSFLDQRARKLAIQKKAEEIGPGYYCFINFLPSSIYNPDFCLQHTFSIVEEYGVKENELVFEVVETEEIDDTNHLKEILYKYQTSGMRVALDDLGAGFNNLEKLSELEPDIIKIDRAYIDDCANNQEKQSFISQAIELGKKLGIVTLAEGIETKEELEWLTSQGVDLAQGYYLGRPAKDPIHAIPQNQ